MTKKVKVYVGLPSTGTCVDLQPSCLRQLAEVYKDEIELCFPNDVAHRIFHDAARNGIVEDFLQSDCDILWMLDSDVVPPLHVLDLVSKHLDKWDVAGAPYPIFMQAGDKTEGRKIVFTAYKRINGGLRPSDVPHEGTDFIDGLATGCLFIKREIFSKLTKPYFEFKYDPETRAPTEGEDLGFCRKLSDLGIQFFTDYSMVCKHYKNVELLEMNNYAQHYAKATIDAYDHNFRLNILPQLVAEIRSRSAQPVAAPAKKSSLILPDHLGG